MTPWEVFLYLVAGTAGAVVVLVGLAAIVVAGAVVAGVFQGLRDRRKR